MMTEDTSNSELLFWGCVGLNQNFYSVSQPQALFEDLRATDVSCGSKFTVILADDGQVFTAGDINWCTSQVFEDPFSWTELFGKNVIKVVSGLNFCAALTSSGTIYTWGTGNCGQLGINEEILNSKFSQQVVSQPYLLDLRNVVDIAAGGESMAAIIGILCVFFNRI